MKVNSLFKMAVLAAFTCAAMGANAADDSGTLTFTGKIIAAGCTVDPTSISTPVELGTFKAADLPTVGSATTPVDFSVHLTNCPSSSSTVALTATGTADTDNAKLLAVTGVTGLGVALYNADGSQIDLNSASAPANIDKTSFEATIPLKAAAVSTATEITAGEFTATSSFTLSYN